MSMERLALNVTLDGTDAVRGIGTVRKAATDGLGEVEKSSTRAATGFTNAGARIVASGAAIAGGLGIAAVGAKVLFDAYSDRTEAVNKTGVVFGDAADRIHEATATAAKDLGMSTTAAEEAAGTFGNLFRAMEIGTDKSADMSLGLIDLASDLASFNNANPTEVLEALRSGLTGETEPLRRFGVNLNEARIKAEAMRLGLVKTNVDQVKVEKSTIGLADAQRLQAEAAKKSGFSSMEYREATNRVAKAQQDLEAALAGSKIELDAAQKAQATYSLVMQDTALAQGDFERTADGAANKQRVLAATLEDTKVKLGEALAPLVNFTLEGALSALTAVSAWWDEHGPAVKQWIKDTFGEDPAASFRAGLEILRINVMDPLIGTAQDLWLKLTDIGNWMRDNIGTQEDFRRGWELIGEKLEWLRINVLDPIVGTLQDILRLEGEVAAKASALSGGDGSIADGARKIAEALAGIAVPGGIPIPEFDTGGVVPGPKGSRQLILAHGGETVVPTHRTSGISEDSPLWDAQTMGNKTGWKNNQFFRNGQRDTGPEWDAAFGYARALEAQSARGNIQIIVNPSPGMDEHALAAAVSRELRTMARATR